MSGGLFPIVARPIVITSANNGLRITEGSLPSATATVAAGTYWIRGDASFGSLLDAVRIAIQEATASTNTYAVTMRLQPFNATVPAFARIARANGSDTFRLDFNDAATTFPVEALGYRRIATALDANAKDADRPANGLWIADDLLSVDDEDEDGDVFGERPASSGAYLGGSLSEPWAMHRWRVERCSRARTWQAGATYADATWQAMHRRIRSGAVVELKRAQIEGNSAVNLADFASAPYHAVGGAGAQWIADQQTRERVGPPQRNAPGVPSYGWSMTWRRRVFV
jgi:hypothetical protein